MKKIILITITFFFLVSITYAQVAINETSNDPAESAMLDVQSTSKGFCLPRMNLAQRDLIADPIESLMIYQFDSIPGFYYYDGQNWVQFNSATNNFEPDYTQVLKLNYDIWLHKDTWDTITFDSTYIQKNISRSGHKIIIQNSGIYDYSIAYTETQCNQPNHEVTFGLIKNGMIPIEGSIGLIKLFSGDEIIMVATSNKNNYHWSPGKIILKLTKISN